MTDLTRAHILGPFNSGTSFAARLLVANDIPLSDIEFQQSLFKHYPGRLLAEIIGREGIDCSDILFVAVARDPGAWIDAMHREPYEMIFQGTDGPCRLDSVAAVNFHRTYRDHLGAVGLTPSQIEAHLSFNNLVDCWHSMYRGYFELAKTVNVTIVRYEDLVEDTAREVLAIRDRMGLPQANTVVIPLAPAKAHGHPKDYLLARTKLRELKAGRPYADAVDGRLEPDLIEQLGYSNDGRRPILDKSRVSSA